MISNSSARLMGGRSCWSLLTVTLLLCAGPTWSQTRTHKPTKPATPKTPAPTNPTPPAGTNPTPPAGTNPTPPSTTPPATTSPSTTKPPVNQPTPTPTPTPPAGGSASIATASDSMRGLLIAVDASGKITLARNAYPPLPMKVAAGAVITRDGAPARLSDLETGSRTAVPDALLVSAGNAADGSVVATKIKATSRDHYWYGRLASIDPNSDSLLVVRADGQRRTFHVNSRTTIMRFGATVNVDSSALRAGMQVEVVWIPGDSDDTAAALEAHRIVLNKPYEGLRR